MIEELISEVLNEAIKSNILLTPYNYYKIFLEIAAQRGIDLEEIKNYLYNEDKDDSQLEQIKEKVSKIIENIKKETSIVSEAISESLTSQKELHFDETDSVYKEVDRLKNINLALKMNLEKAMRNIEMERGYLEKIKVKIYKDSLTGLYLKEFLFIKLKENLYYMQRYERAFSLLMIDADDFKGINDKHGHQIGDNVLFQIGKLIKKNIRASDIPVRYGGDEFIILMPEIELLGARKAAEKFAEKMSKVIFKKKGEEFKVTFSIGVASARKNDTLESILERVDTALYSSKRAGKNCITVFD